jgi:hypothetical protein
LLLLVVDFQLGAVEPAFEVGVDHVAGAIGVPLSPAEPSRDVVDLAASVGVEGEQSKRLDHVEGPTYGRS